MKQEMFVQSQELETDKRSKGDNMQMEFYLLIDHINALLAESTFSPSELYEELIYRRILKSGHLKEFKRILRTGIREGLIKKDKLYLKVSTCHKFPNFFIKEQFVKSFR